MKHYELILFDLDGTLLDTSPGIFNSVRYAESQMGLTPIPDSQLREFVGPPPKSMYQRIYGLSEDAALQAAQKHREYGKTKAIYEAQVYPGIQELLAQLKASGYKLAVATLKAETIARTILEYYGIAEYFDTIVGMDPQETLTKRMTIDLAKERTGSAGKTILVGDSIYDYDGAMEAGIDFLGVLYGFGFAPENSYPFDAVMTVAEVGTYLGSKQTALCFSTEQKFVRVDP